MRIMVSDLSYTYREGTINSLPILKDISFTVEGQDLFGIIGQSGAGKTTMAQLVAGLMEPSSGGIRYSIQDRNNLRVGMVFQNPEEQFFEETLAKDIRAGLLEQGWDEATMERNIQRAFQWVGLEYAKYADRSSFSLSGGERRLAAIACVLCADPEVILFDEPTAGLDPAHRRRIYRLIKTLNRQGKTVLVVSHDLEWLMPLVNRLLLMKNGTSLWSGKTAHLFSQPELFRDAGLELPEIPDLMMRLAESGFPVNGLVLTVKEAAEVIVRSFKENHPEKDSSADTPPLS